MKFLTMTTMLMGDIIPSRAYLALTVIAIGGRDAVFDKEDYFHIVVVA
jgi:hypothetical protein